ncbi:MAG: hypothetical protein SF052_21930 [Bacteroidia bacterium]|nr:hypothetical protein [Bacteroidia bacterium]
MEPQLYLQKRADNAYQLHLKLQLRRGYDFAGISHISFNPDSCEHNICREVKITLARIPYTAHEAPLELALPISIREKAEGCGLRVVVVVIPQGAILPESPIFEKIICLKDIVELREKKHSGAVTSYQWTRVRSL